MIVIDNFLSDRGFAELSRYAKECAYWQNQVSDIHGDLSDLRFAHHFDLEHFDQTELCKTIFNEVGICEVDQAYINANNYGTTTKAHIDSVSEGDKTLLLYLNDKWDRNWQGYTVFFESLTSDKVIDTIVPVPNRAVIFDSSLWHLACNATKDAPVRYTLAVKLKNE